MCMPFKLGGKELPYEMHMSTRLGKLSIANRIMPNCEFRVGKEIMKADLIVMAIEDYDLILGMDWLPKHGTRVDCRNKVVQFVRPR
jgi:hypothetical protein